MLSKTEEGLSSVEFIYCACGCGKTRSKYDTSGNQCKYIKNHHYKILAIRNRGSNNTNWKADNISNWGLHKWLRDNIPKPEFCEMCKDKTPRDMANITGTYNRELKNWAWFCSRCHKYYDNIIERNLTMKGKYMYRNPKTGRFIKRQ